MMYQYRRGITPSICHLTQGGSEAVHCFHVKQIHTSSCHLPPMAMTAVNKGSTRQVLLCSPGRACQSRHQWKMYSLLQLRISSTSGNHSMKRGMRQRITVRVDIGTLMEQPFNVPPFLVAYEFLVQVIRNLVGQLLEYLRMLSSRYILQPFFVIFDSLSSLFLWFIPSHSTNLHPTTSHSFPFISPPLPQDIQTDCKMTKKIFN